MGKINGATLVLWAIFVGFTAVSFAAFGFGHSPDLMATWLAGHFHAAGATDQVYAGYDGLYTMLPPSEWWPFLQEQGREKAVFPFVYPPIWAVLAGWITPFVGLDAFQAGASFVNPLLMAGMVTLAGRATGLRDWALVRFLLLGLGVMVATLPGSVALEQNQPQILVSFLIVAAIERDRAGAARLAGAALALAAAIKLYPAMLALLWLASGRGRSVASFAIVGSVLGAVSILLAGWPLHQTFLSDVSAIKNTALVTYFTFGVDPTVAQIAFADDLQFVAGLDNAADAQALLGWSVLQKGAVWSGLSLAAMLGLALGGASYARRTSDVLFWPAFLVGLALISPLSWGYHYLPALAFLPAMIDRFGPRRGGLIVLGIAAPLTLPALGVFSSVTATILLPQIAGTLAMIGLGLALFLAPSRSKD
ncbi:glycosyltransferase 87 family protein [Marivivens marinus]|uniref:glycosyltransferase 87 family protein n=1 Tax=Marivivens marinus TaxID=3110173 RepID=UPI003B847C04